MARFYPFVILEFLNLRVQILVLHGKELSANRVNILHRSSREWRAQWKIYSFPWACSSFVINSLQAHLFPSMFTVHEYVSKSSHRLEESEKKSIQILTNRRNISAMTVILPVILPSHGACVYPTYFCSSCDSPIWMRIQVLSIQPSKLTGQRLLKWTLWVILNRLNIFSGVQNT